MFPYLHDGSKNKKKITTNKIFRQKQRQDTVSQRNERKSNI